jgi:hypothetical protein
MTSETGLAKRGKAGQSGGVGGRGDGGEEWRSKSRKQRVE